MTVIEFRMHIDLHHLYVPDYQLFPKLPCLEFVSHRALQLQHEAYHLYIYCCALHDPFGSSERLKNPSNPNMERRHGYERIITRKIFIQQCHPKFAHIITKTSKKVLTSKRI